MFRADADDIQHRAQETQRQYTIQPYDELTVEVYTNKGEKIIDPNRQSFADAGTAVSALPRYPVAADGNVLLPLIGQIPLTNLTLREAEERLTEAYGAYYEEPFVVLRFTNKRVTVLGTPGGRVIPLQHEQMRLSEVLALAEGITPEGRADNIRVLRGDEVFVADFSTVAGYRNNDIVLAPGDIVYVEPARRPVTQTLRDFSPLVSIATSLITVIYLVTQSGR